MDNLDFLRSILYQIILISSLKDLANKGEVADVMILTSIEDFVLSHSDFLSEREIPSR